MNTQTTPKDFFLHLGATVVLYAAAIALMNLAFGIINYALPDVLAYYGYSRNLAWPISMVIVLVPILYVLEWLIKRDIRLMPEKANIWIRKWRIYLTLFLTGATIVGDLIALLNTYFSGEITSRFVYKILAVFLVAGVVFAYYLLQRLNANPNVIRWTKILSWSGLVVALAGVVAGFIIVGSPTTQRMIRFDQQKVSDLQNIQWQIVSYWQAKGKLPASLLDVKDNISYSNIPLDPQSKLPYDYTSLSSTTFQLCANFNRDREDPRGRGQYGGMGMTRSSIDIAVPVGEDSWDHGKGKVCFDRQIDQDRYPVQPLKK